MKLKEKIVFNKPMKYKEICKMFGDEILNASGNKRTNQLKRWNKEYLVTKDKTWYTIIRERTDEEKIALASTKEYAIYIENILINMLKHLSDEADKNHVRFSYHELFEKLGITNELYYKVLNENKITKEEYSLLVSTKNKIDNDVVLFNLDVFFSESQTLLKRMIDDALKSMEQQMLIISGKSYRLFTNIKLPDGKYAITKHDCTDEETEEILYIFNSLLEKYHVKKINDIYGLEKEIRNSYFLEVSKKIRDTFKCDYYCKTFDIVLTRKGIDREYNKLLNKNKLNNNVQNKLLNSKVLKKSVAEVLLQVFIEDLIRK